MSSLYHLCDVGTHIEENVVESYKNFATDTKGQFFAAVKIQRIWRGYHTRKVIQSWNYHATVLQKYIRGFLVRYQLPTLLMEAYDELCINYYNKMASKIKSFFKGAKLRRDICIKEKLVERQQIQKENEDIIDQIKYELQGQKDESHPRFQKEAIKSNFHVLLDKHHLLRTYHIEGVLSLHGKKELSDLETCLKMMSWTNYMKELKKIYSLCTEEKKPPEYMFEDKRLREQEDLFRQRYKFDDVREPMEFQEYVQKKPFYLHSMIRRPAYDPMISTSQKYTTVIRNISRSEDKSKQICEDDFKLSKNIASYTDKCPYNPNFWFRKCDMHYIFDNDEVN